MKRNRDVCPVCQRSRPHGRELSWWAILGTFFGFWPGWTWTGAGFVHRDCLPVWVQQLRSEVSSGGQ